MRHFLYSLFALMLIASADNANAQVIDLVVEQVENEAKVPGKTYRLYARMTHENDQLLVVYGDSLNPLLIKSSKPFYQHPQGGGMAKNSLRKKVAETAELKHDSWITIGGEDNYECSINVLNLDLTDFESTGGAIAVPKDGAWFTLPTDMASKAGTDKKILLGQFTTKGNLEGKVNIMTKCANGESKQQFGLTFKSGK